MREYIDAQHLSLIMPWRLDLGSTRYGIYGRVLMISFRSSYFGSVNTWLITAPAGPRATHLYRLVIEFIDSAGDGFGVLLQEFCGFTRHEHGSFREYEVSHI